MSGSDSDEPMGAFTWEQAHERPWETLKESKEGTLVGVDKLKQSLVEDARALRGEDGDGDGGMLRRGIIRRLYVILDMSGSLRSSDVRPTRHSAVIKGMEAFVREFFDLNPISQMGLIVTKSRKATLVTEMGGNPTAHIEALTSSATAVGAEPSLQNALKLARSSLASLPRYGVREILVVFSSLTTCDPGNVLATINDIRDDGITASVIGFGASLRVLGYLADATGGRYNVPTSGAHFRSLLLSHAVPTTVKEGSASFGNALVRMGFPGMDGVDASASDAPGSLCACHQYLTTSGYICPHCGSKMCEIPSDCVTCGLTLVAPPHLARSYHHLFPVAKYLAPTPEHMHDLPGLCFGCSAVIPSTASVSDAAFSVCPLCSQRFCFSCDEFVHFDLHGCPGCQIHDSAPAAASFPTAP